jgi:hypothetical protein
MNKSALALAGFGFAAGIVLIIVVEPLLHSEPKTTSPQLAAMVAKPTLVLPDTAPAPHDDPAVKAAKVALAKSLKDPPSAVFSELKHATRPNVRGEPLDTVCGLVNAKNSFGGYTGPRGFVYFVNDGAVNIAEGSEPYALGPIVVRNICK